MRNRLHFVLTLVLFSLLAVLVSAHASARSDAATATIIAADMSPGAPGIQTSVTYPAETTPSVDVDIVVQEAPETGAFEFGVVVPNWLHYTGYATGPFLGSTGRSPACFQVPGTPEGRVRIACATLQDSPPGASGDGVLATLHFDVLVPGDACILFYLAELSDIGGNPIPAVAQGGCVSFAFSTPEPTPTPAEPQLVGDVDGDCGVSVLDFALIIQRFGFSFGSLLYAPAYDLNHDGTISISDVEIAAAHFGEVC